VSLRKGQGASLHHGHAAAGNAGETVGAALGRPSPFPLPFARGEWEGDFQFDHGTPGGALTRLPGATIWHRLRGASVCALVRGLWNRTDKRDGPAMANNRWLTAGADGKPAEVAHRPALGGRLLASRFRRKPLVSRLKQS
jgi:hypothetical protein